MNPGDSWQILPQAGPDLALEGAVQVPWPIIELLHHLLNTDSVPDIVLG